MNYVGILEITELAGFVNLFFILEVSKITKVEISACNSEGTHGELNQEGISKPRAMKQIFLEAKFLKVTLTPDPDFSDLLDSSFDDGILKTSGWDKKFAKITQGYSGIQVGEVGDEDVNPNRVLEKGSGEGWTPLT